MKRPLVANFALLLLTSLLCIGASELILRALGRYSTYSEVHGRGYLSPYVQPAYSPWIRIRPPFSTAIEEGPEFAFELRMNSEGIRGKEYEIEKPKGMYRVIILGDSFVEGIGAAFEDTIGEQLQQAYDAVDCARQVQIIPAGVAGSDPAFSYYLLKDHFLQYQPDLVVLVVNHSDIEDYMARGGMNRFDQNGTVLPRSDRPSFEPLYIHSHVVRAILRDVLHYDNLLLSPEQEQEWENTALDQLMDTFVEFGKLAKENRIKLAIAFHPQAAQFSNPPPSEKLRDFTAALNEKGVRFVDMTKRFTSRIHAGNMKTFFWPINGHFTAAGYTLLAQGLVDILQRTQGFPKCPWPAVPPDPAQAVSDRAKQ